MAAQTKSPEKDSVPTPPETVTVRLKKGHTHKRVFHKAGSELEVTRHEAELLTKWGVI